MLVRNLAGLPEGETLTAAHTSNRNERLLVRVPRHVASRGGTRCNPVMQDTGHTPIGLHPTQPTRNSTRRRARAQKDLDGANRCGEDPPGPRQRGGPGERLSLQGNHVGRMICAKQGRHHPRRRPKLSEWPADRLRHRTSLNRRLTE